MPESTDRTTVTVLDVSPERSFFGPGEERRVAVDLESVEDVSGTLVVTALHPAAAPVEARFDVRLAAGATSLSVTLPPATRGGRQLSATFTTDAGASSGAVGAVDVLGDWRHDPRYGFLCEFGPEAGAGVSGRVAAMRRYHLTCVQLYDWMYRHHELVAPDESYADVLGREMTLGSVRAAVAAVHDERMAALAYATVYAAEKEFCAEHPDWQLYDDDGRPWQLADLFFLMDLGPGTAWSDHMLDQLRTTGAAMDFDGYHLDQYGFPRTAHRLSGEVRDTAAGFDDFVRRADAVVQEQRPLGGSIFNNVNAWPVTQMAPLSGVATYIEVWRPHTDYRDLVELTARALQAAPGTPVVLAAYAGFLRKEPATDLAAGGLALLAAVTLAAGAWPLLVGEGDHVLTGGYYPEYATVVPEVRTALLAVLDAGVAWRDLLRAPHCRRVADAFVDGQDAETWLDQPYSSRPLPGHVWVSMVRCPGWLVLSLVNLLDATSPRWNAAQPTPARRSVTLRLPQGVVAGGVVVASTTAAWSQAPTASGEHGRTITVDLDVWTLVAMPHPEPAG